MNDDAGRKNREQSDKQQRCDRPHLPASGGAMVTLTYGGSSRVMPNYNVMGVAKAALEASVRYLAADFGPRRIRINALRGCFSL